MSFQVDPDSRLWQPAKQAAEAWSKAIGRPITVTPDGDIPIFETDEFGAECEARATTNGCSRLTKGDAYTTVLSSVPVERLYGVLLHEMGHHLRGVSPSNHLSDPNAVMHSPRTAEVLTPADVRFICEQFDCAPPNPAS